MITLESGEKVAYDDLIIATGTGGPFPAKLPLDTNKEKAEERYEDYVKLVSAVSNSTIIVCGCVAALVTVKVLCCCPNVIGHNGQRGGLHTGDNF